MKTHQQLVRLTTCAVFAAFLCVCSPLTIPLAGPVPFALQNYAVMVCAVTLDWAQAQLSMGVYLALGLFLPLFSGGNTGLTALLGPTGGYIWSYLLMVPVICLFRRLPHRRRWEEYALSMTGCTLAACLCYLCGTLQFCLLSGSDLRRALALCVLPFLPLDLLKAAAATLLGVELRRILKTHGFPLSSSTP